MKAKIYDTLFLLVLLLAFSTQLPATIAVAYLLCAVYILMAYDRPIITAEQLLVWSIAMIPCLLAVLNYNHGLTSAFYLFSFPFLIVAAKIFGSKSREHIVSCLGTFYWLFVLGVVVGLVLHWDEPEPLGAIFPGTSTNGLPSYLIVVQIALSLSFYLKNNRLPLLSAVATLVIAVFGLGRGSIITAAIIFLFSAFVNISVVKSMADRKLFFLASCLLVPISGLYLYVNYDEIESAVDLYYEGSKFSGGVLDEHRGRILADYLEKMDAWGLIFGMDYTGTSIDQYYGGNPHNSFVRVHSFYGAAGIFFVILTLVFLIFSDRDRVQKSISLILIAFALLRATTEPIFFPSTLDFFYVLYFVVFFNFARRRNRVCSENV